MPRIVPDIPNLPQHLALMFSDPERYRPAACSACGLARPWSHGTYTRKSDRSLTGEGPGNPIPIPRFICREPACRHTCPRLPSCIPPRRWHLWEVQQIVLLLALTETSLSALAHHFAPRNGPARSKLRRWKAWLSDAPLSWVLHLKSPSMIWPARAMASRSGLPSCAGSASIGR